MQPVNSEADKTAATASALAILFVFMETPQKLKL